MTSAEGDAAEAMTSPDESLRAIYSALAEDPEMAELVEQFVRELPERVSALAQAVERGEIAEVGRLAHQLKGAGGSYGLRQLSGAAAALERAARRGGSEAEIHSAASELAGICGRVRGGTQAAEACWNSP